jgi:hypothetical protein
MLTGSQATHDLDGYEEDPSFQRRFWRVERIAWGLYAAIILAALSGITGSGGVFARSEIRLAAGTLDLPRVFRWQTPAAINVELHMEGRALPILVENGFLELFEIETVLPEPLSTRATFAGVVYIFDAQTSGAIRLNIQARRPALFADASIWIGEEQARIRPLILP